MNENVNQKALYMFCHTTLETEQTRFSSPEKNNGAPPVAPISSLRSPETSTRTRHDRHDAAKVSGTSKNVGKCLICVMDERKREK